MSYAQYKVRCTSCDTDTYLVCQESNPIIYKCKGCKRYVVIWNDQAFTVNENFFLKTIKKHNLKYCGQITKICKTEKPEETKPVKKNEITDTDIQELHEFLSKTKDSSEIIKKL